MEIITKEGQKINRYTLLRIRMSKAARKEKRWVLLMNWIMEKSFMYPKNKLV